MKKPFLLLIVSMLAMSCERITTMKADGDGHLAVECILTEEKEQTLRLTGTDIIQSPLENAVITLKDETENTIAGVFYYTENFIWKLDYKAIPTHKYMLTVNVKGHKTITAQTQMPETLDVKYVKYKDNIIHDNDRGTRYLIESLPNGAVWFFPLHYCTANIATDLKSADNFNLTGSVYYNKYNHEHHHYFNQDGEIYYHYIEGYPNHKRCLRIPPVSENPNRTSDEPLGYFSIAYTNDELDEGVNTSAMCCSLSYDYDRYLKELFSMKMSITLTGDFSELFADDNLYTNIQNGTGIFGAQTSQVLPHEIYYEPEWC